MSTARRILIIVLVSILLIAALAAAYVVYDQSVNGWRVRMDAALSLYCKLDSGIEVSRCDAWVADVLASYPDIVRACELGESFTYSTEAECVLRNPVVPKLPQG